MRKLDQRNTGLVDHKGSSTGSSHCLSLPNYSKNPLEKRGSIAHPWCNGCLWLFFNLRSTSSRLVPGRLLPARSAAAGGWRPWWSGGAAALPPPPPPAALPRRPGVAKLKWKRIASRSCGQRREKDFERGVHSGRHVQQRCSSHGTFSSLSVPRDAPRSSGDTKEEGKEKKKKRRRVAAW
jgi:hypothetical protein